MEKAVFDFARRFMEMNHLTVTVLEKEKAKDDYDLGLRRSFYGEEAYHIAESELWDKVPERTVLYIRDEYKCYYVVLRVPRQDILWIIGPYLLEEITNEDLGKLEEELQMPLDHRKHFREYMRSRKMLGRSIPFRNLISLLASQLYGGDDRYAEVFDETRGTLREYTEQEDQRFLIREKEIRFEVMNELLEAVRNGNSEKALRCLVRFRSMIPAQRFRNTLRDAQYFLIVFNTQLRMTAQAAGIHPFFVGEIAEKYSFKIDAMTSDKDYSKLMQEMIRGYCMLINNQNLSQYSGVIRDAIMQIQIGLSEELSLRSIAGHLNINPSYLSALFTKEVGMPLTEYIHKKRIEASMQYMNDPSVPIKEIIVRIGIYDLNYFSRLFKRYVGMSPTQYRKEIMEKKG